MIKRISLVLVLILILNLAGQTVSVAMMTKSGVLPSSEVWSGEVNVTGDVTVPKGSELTIKPGTMLLYEKDRNGKSPDLIVYGTLKVGDTNVKSGDFRLVPLDSKTKIIQITPYEVDTKILRDEFAAFKLQYAIIWVLLGGGLIYAVSHR